MQGWMEKVVLAAVDELGPNKKVTFLTFFLGAVLITAPALAGTVTRTSAFEYDSVTGLLIKEIIEPDNAQLRLETVYTRDVFGNIVQTTTSSPATGQAAIASRTSTVTFDTYGRFITTATNTLSQSETRAFDARFGGPTSLTGPNGLTTTWTYDNFARKTLETRADGTQTKVDYQFCSGVNGGIAVCPSGAKYVVKSTPFASDGTTQIGAASWVYFDQLNREMRSESQNFDASTIVVQTQYDSFGRVSQKSRPYTVGGTPQWTVLQYDILGRVIGKTDPDMSVTTFAFQGLTTSVTNALNQTRTITKNTQGQTQSVTDELNHTTSFAYDEFGNVKQSTDAASNVTSFDYDLRGRKISMADPDMGTWSYVYDALGQLVQQTDAKSQVTTYTYDLLGRMIGRTEPATSGGTVSSSWIYDTATKGVGKLASTTSAGYSRIHSYDTLGRPSGVSITIDTVTNSYATTYDGNGRVDTVTYPSGFGVKYVYTQLGYLSEIRNKASNAPFWQINAMNADRQITQFTHGNGVVTNQSYEASTGRLSAIQAGTSNAVQNLSYSYDTIGNVLGRSDTTQSVAETFQYDGMNRLIQASLSVSDGTPVTKTYGYDELGNMTSKSDVGTYSYPASGATSVRPHAVSSITGAMNGVTNPIFTYDANGNMLTGADRTLVWNAANLPETITEGARSLTFTYDSERARIKQVASSGTTTYWNDPTSGAKAEMYNGTSTWQWNNYVFAGDGISVIYYETGGASTGVNIRYIHRDNLGSTSVTTDENGTVVERSAYDGWGRRRYPNGTDDDAANTLNTAVRQTDKGFTGHEHLEEVALIHMNGRIYDPLVGRFMSADPFIQAPMNSQSYNRYSYVINNPLVYTDPSGHLFGIRIKFKTVVAIAVVAVFQQYELLGALAPSIGLTTAVTNGIVGGAIAGGISGGGLTGVVTGGVSGGIFAGVGDLAQEWKLASGSIGNVALHAGAGGLTGAIQNGDFKSGFVAAGFSEALGPENFDNMGFAGGLVVNAVAGGAAAKIVGGNFENGARTSTYSYLFNYCAHNGCFDRAFTLTDAVDQWRNGNGGVVTDVDANEIDLKGAGFIGGRTKGLFQVNLSPATDSYYKYGTVTGRLNSDNTMSFNKDTYDFDYKNLRFGQNSEERNRLLFRNIGTALGRVYNGSGTPYDIHFSGSQALPQDTVTRLQNCPAGQRC